MNILGVGIATLDIVNKVSTFPSENTEVRALSQRICRGGNVTNMLSVLSQFQYNCSWAGVLCNDTNSQHIRDDLSKHNIDYSLCHRLENGKSPTSYILHNEETGSRSIVHYRDMPEFSFQHFKQITLGSFDWIHFEGRAISETVQMLEWCKTHYPNIPLSVEIEKEREGIEKIFGLADLYLYSKAYANALYFDDAITFLASEQEKSPYAALICAWGETGSYGLIDQAEIFEKADCIDLAIDTLGAGDTFIAGIIHAQLKKLDWPDSLAFANRLAGKKCRQIGFAGLAD